MTNTVSRKGAVDTFTEAFEWLQENPLLIGLFFVLGVVNALGEVSFLLTIVGMLLSVFLGGVAHLYARDELSGETPDFDRAKSHVLGRMVSLVVVFVVYIVTVMIGLILLILPGIYLALRLSLALPACVIDEKDPMESLSTSWDVAQGNLLKLLGISLLSLLVFVAAGLFAGVLAMIGLGFLPAIILLTAVLTAVLTPIVEMSYARVYLENRETGVAGTATGDQTEERTDDAWSDGDAAGI